MGAHCVSSWISYGLKQGIPWHVFYFSLFILILCLPVHEKYKHFLAWDHVVSSHGTDKALNRPSHGIFLFLFVFINVCLPVHENHEKFRVEILPPQPLLLYFLFRFSPLLLLLLLLCLTNVTNQPYHETESD